MLRKKQQIPSRRSQTAAVERTRITEGELAERYAFRRNRTLTGSLSSNVASANEHHSELRSPRVHAHHLKRHRHKLTGLLLLTLSICGLLGFLIYQSVVIPRVVAQTTQPIDAPLYESKIQAYLSSRMTERFRFSLDPSSLTKYLQTNGCPEIESVSQEMAFNGFGVTKLILRFRTPAVAWRTGSSQLYVDEQGNAFQRNYFTAPSVQIVDQTGIQSKDNQVLASNRFLGFIGRLIGRMHTQQLTVTKVALPADSTRQLLVSVDGISYPIKLSVDRPTGEQAEDVARAIHYLRNKGITPEYLDVRVSGKAFYR